MDAKEWNEQGIREWIRANGVKGMDSALFGFAPACGGLSARHKPEWIVFALWFASFVVVLLLWAYGVKLQPSGSPTAVGVASFAFGSFISKPMLGTLERICFGTMVSAAKIKALSSTGPFFPGTLILRTQ